MNSYNKNKKIINNKKKSNKKEYQIIGYPNQNSNYGNFVGRYPAQAAHKALNLLSKKIDMNNSNDKNQMKFWLKEKKNNKYYCYIGSRIKLKQPNIIIRDGKKIFYHYKTILRKCKKHELDLNL